MRRQRSARTRAVVRGSGKHRRRVGHRFSRGVAAVVFVVTAMVPVMAASAPEVAAAGVVPPGAPSPQPSPQCPPPASLKDWFQPNCPYSWTFADPSVVVVPDDPNLGGATGYYAYATNTGGATLPVMWTTDPVGGPWVPRPAYTNSGSYFGDSYFNDALAAPYVPGGNQPPAWMLAEAPANSSGWGRKKSWAPGTIRIDATRYVTYFAGKDRVGNHWCIGHATATNPWGPFTAAATADICSAPDGSPNGVLDPQPFRAANGKLYLHYKSEGVPGSKPTSIYSRPLQSNGLLATGTPKKIYSTNASWQMTDPAHGVGVVENPAMTYFKGRYYLFYSGNEWKTDNYGIGYAVCSGPNGPCTNKSASAPFLRSGSGFTGAGGATPFITEYGSLMIGFAAWNVPGSHSGGTRTFRTRRVYANASGTLTMTAPTPVSNAAKDGKFVRAAYLDFLDRAATAAEANGWSNSISVGDVTRKGFLDGLTTSDAWLGATVDRMYQDTLGRAGDPGGRAYWIGQLKARKKTVAQVAAMFYSSDEYFTGFGHSDVRTWVLDLYDKLLGRSGAGDTAGVDYWVARTAQIGRDLVARNFYETVESRHARVRNLYLKLLNREPEPGGWDYWAGQVLKTGDLALAADLAASPEYYDRSQTR